VDAAAKRGPAERRVDAVAKWWGARQSAAWTRWLSGRGGMLTRLVREGSRTATATGGTAMGMIQEFKEFAMRGNVVDMAVGVVMGTAFGRIVSSLVTNVITPPIGYVTGGVDFRDLKFDLPTKAGMVPDPDNPAQMVSGTLEPVSIGYGEFLQATFDFMIVAACIFLLVKTMNTIMRKKAEAPVPPQPTTTEKLLTEIRDALQGRPGGA
jgi:large conductance mechanosensitive channel